MRRQTGKDHSTANSWKILASGQRNSSQASSAHQTIFLVQGQVQRRCRHLNRKHVLISPTSESLWHHYIDAVLMRLSCYGNADKTNASLTADSVSESTAQLRVVSGVTSAVWLACLSSLLPHAACSHYRLVHKLAHTFWMFTLSQFGMFQHFGSLVLEQIWWKNIFIH